ncbi:helix-turn-helix domain-containing protein [Kibdelosporangium lantanae]
MPEDPREVFANRLRALREERWPGTHVTQLQLAEALGGAKPLSISLISSWENATKPAFPTKNRLKSYATFFATERSLASSPYRLLAEAELTDDERDERDELLEELVELRDAATSSQAVPTPVQVRREEPGDEGFWRFPDGEIVTIVCAPLPQDLRQEIPSYTNPNSADYVALYTYADLDALIELYGHLRMLNPGNRVNFMTAADLQPDDYSSHLVLLGGVDWNAVTREVTKSRRVEIPVRQELRDTDDPNFNGFEVLDGDENRVFRPVLDASKQLLEDVTQFYRGPNPYNKKRTVTICNGMYGRGTLGAVRALTDARFRDRNNEYIKRRFSGESEFSILSRILVVQGKVVTPDWTAPDTVLHEWPSRE